MFIIWGTKIVRRVLGRTADYCYLCRDFQPARVVDVQSVGHLYYIPMGRGQTLGLEQTCERCGLVRTMEPGSDPPQVLRDRQADVEWLLAGTNPNAKQIWASRLAQDARLRGGSVLPKERLDALYESFGLANQLIEARISEMRFDSLSGSGCLVTLAAAFGAAYAAETLLKTNIDNTLAVGVGVGIVLGILTLILVARGGRRFARRKVLPVLARTIRPLKPRDEEIEQVMATLREGGLKIGKLLTPHQITEAMMLLND